MAFDTRTGPDVMGVILSPHAFLAMGLLFIAAIVSSVVLYAPFMRKLDFGTVRKSGSRRAGRLSF